MALKKTSEVNPMHFKLIITLVEDSVTEKVIEAARSAGATGSTVINHARGEGVNQSKTFLGLTLDTQRDVLLLLVEEHLSRTILEKISEAGQFEEEPGNGIAFQIDIEDAVGVSHQIQTLTQVIEEEL
jgi:nitrogen regulatory protein PII